MKPRFTWTVVHGKLRGGAFFIEEPGDGETYIKITDHETGDYYLPQIEPLQIVKLLAGLGLTVPS